MGDNRTASVTLAIKISKDLRDDMLTMENFEKWSDILRAVLEDVSCGNGNQAQSVWDTVLDIDNNNDPAPGQGATPAQLARYQQGISFAKMLIQLTVDAANKSAIRNKNPRQAWQHLQSIHRSRAPVNHQKIEDKMNKMSITTFRTKGRDEEQACMMYTSAMADLRERYLAAGGNMDEAALYYKIVRNLPSEYRNYKDYLNTKENDLTIAFLSTYLTRAAISLQQREPADDRERKEGKDDILITTKPARKQGGVRQRQTKELCNNFLRSNTCKYNDACRYLHLTTSDIQRFATHADKIAQKQDNNQANTMEYADDFL